MRFDKLRFYFKNKLPSNDNIGAFTVRPHKIIDTFVKEDLFMIYNSFFIFFSIAVLFFSFIIPDKDIRFIFFGIAREDSRGTGFRNTTIVITLYLLISGIAIYFLDSHIDSIVTDDDLIEETDRDNTNKYQIDFFPGFSFFLYYIAPLYYLTPIIIIIFSIILHLIKLKKKRRARLSREQSNTESNP